MELAGFFQPNSVEETKTLLSEHSNVKLLAGGTDLLLNLKRGDQSAQYIIDLGRISELKAIAENEGQVVVGSMVTFTQLRESKLIKDNFKSLFECAKNMGSPQIRNTATIGGNIINAGSAADAVPCIISLRGMLVIESANGTRQVSCEDYFKNYSKEKINEKEILTKIILPKRNEKSGYYKLGKRNSLAIARVSAALSFSIEDNRVKSIALSLGAVGRYPFRAAEFEKCAAGQNQDWLSGEEALGFIENAVYESIKGRKTMPFKKEAVKGVYREALRIALEK